jgi:protein gp37
MRAVNIAKATQVQKDNYEKRHDMSGTEAYVYHEKMFAKIRAYENFTPMLHADRLAAPSRKTGRCVIGVCFMGDWCDPGLSDHARSEVLDAMLEALHHTYILLTKQPENMARVIDSVFPSGAPSNVDWYLGFSARNQSEFDAGWPHMAKLAAAGWKVWVSLEPMQGPIDLEVCPGCEKNCEQTLCQTGPAIHSLSTVILGAQSGKNAVPLQKEWVESVQIQCEVVGIPFMFKQGTNPKSPERPIHLPELDGKVCRDLAWTMPKT